MVSEIVSSTDPQEAAIRVYELISAFKRSSCIPRGLSVNSEYNTISVIDGVIRLMNTIQEHNPLIHQVSL